MELNEKQVQILQVAEKLFAENGFDGTSVRSIAKEAGVNLAMISYYFGSKENMLSTLLTYRATDFKIQISSVLDTELSYLEKADAVVALTIKKIHNNRRIYKITHFEYSNLSRNVDFNDYVQKKKENFQFIEAFIKEGQDAGAFVQGLNAPLIISTITGTYFNFYYNKRFFQDMHNLQGATSIDDYIFNILTPHVQKTIKALLTYEE